jgi:transcriptional repressor NrdR
MVVKKDGRREEFSLAKLRGGLAKACNKRPVATEDIARAAEDIEAQLRRDGTLEVASDRVGELVMDKLFALDQVAYVRFASVYQRFDDVKRFAQILDRISRRGRTKNKSTSAANAPMQSENAPSESRTESNDENKSAATL